MSAQDLPPTVDPAWEAALAFLPFVRRVAREFRRGEWDTDDLIQEGLIAARNAFARFDPVRGSFFRLVDVAVHNRMRTWLRWRRRLACESDYASLARAQADRIDFESLLAHADRVDVEALEDVRAAIDRLPERRRTILGQHFGLQGPVRKAEDIGVDLGMTRCAVAKNQSRALDKVREHLGVAS